MQKVHVNPSYGLSQDAIDKIILQSIENLESDAKFYKFTDNIFGASALAFFLNIYFINQKDLKSTKKLWMILYQKV